MPRGVDLEARSQKKGRLQPVALDDGGVWVDA